MFRGEDDVADTGEFGENSPIFGVEPAGVERFGQIFEEVLGVIIRGAHERVTDDGTKLAVDAPVNEEAEALIAEPFDAIRHGCRLRLRAAG